MRGCGTLYVQTTLLVLAIVLPTAVCILLLGGFCMHEMSGRAGRTLLGRVKVCDPLALKPFSSHNVCLHVVRLRWLLPCIAPVHAQAARNATMLHAICQHGVQADEHWDHGLDRQARPSTCRHNAAAMTPELCMAIPSCAGARCN